MDFDDIWQKYSKDFRIECASFLPLWLFVKSHTRICLYCRIREISIHTVFSSKYSKKLAKYLFTRITCIVVCLFLGVILSY